MRSYCTLLRGARLALGLTQRQVSEQAGVSRSTVSGIELRGGSAATVVKVAEVYGPAVAREVRRHWRRRRAG